MFPGNYHLTVLNGLLIVYHNDDYCLHNALISHTHAVITQNRCVSLCFTLGPIRWESLNADHLNSKSK